MSANGSRRRSSCDRLAHLDFPTGLDRMEAQPTFAICVRTKSVQKPESVVGFSLQVGKRHLVRDGGFVLRHRSPRKAKAAGLLPSR